MLGANRTSRQVNRMKVPVGQTKVMTDQMGERIDLLRIPTLGHLEDPTLKRTIRWRLYSACCVKAPTNCSTNLIEHPSVHSKCPYKRAMTRVEPATDKREDQDNPKMGTLEILSAIQRKVDPKEVTEKGLTYIDATSPNFHPIFQ